MKQLLLVALALGIGAGAGHYFTKRYYKDFINNELDEEINSIREAYARDEQRVKDFVKEESIRSGVKPVERDEDYDYSKYAPDMDIPEGVNVVTEEKEVIPMKEVNKEPYLITDNEYLSEELEYEKVGLYYYDKDNVLTDDVDDVVEDTDTIGDDILNMFIEDPDLSAIYVRNESMEADYEIIRVIGSYSDNE